MKSGPTLNPATLLPRSAKAPISPVATVVLPTPEWVPATTTLAVIGQPPASRSPLDPLLAADAPVEGMLELAHLGDEVGDLDQRLGGIAAGDDHVLEVAGDPGPTVTHALPGDVAEPLGRLPLADAPLAGLDELVDADPVASCPGAQHDAERGGGLSLALPGVDDQQGVIPPRMPNAFARTLRVPGVAGHATRLLRERLAPPEPTRAAVPEPGRATEPGPGRAVVPVTARTSPARGWAASASKAMHGPFRASASSAASPNRTTAASVSTTTAATPAAASALASAIAAVTGPAPNPSRDAGPEPGRAAEPSPDAEPARDAEPSPDAEAAREAMG